MTEETKRKPTPRRSPLEESPLAALVEDVTAEVAAEERAARDDLVTLTMRERAVPRGVAEIIVDRGYSKGTALRIVNDAARRLRLQGERA